MSAVIQKAHEKDYKRLREFASASGVSTQGILGELGCYYLMEDEEGQLMAMAGVEDVESYALLRSLVLDPETCGFSEIMPFLEAVVRSAEQAGHEGAVLMTASPDLFEWLGFQETTSDTMPEAIKPLSRISVSRKAVLMLKKF